MFAFLHRFVGVTSHRIDQCTVGLEARDGTANFGKHAMAFPVAASVPTDSVGAWTSATWNFTARLICSCVTIWTVVSLCAANRRVPNAILHGSICHRLLGRLFLPTSKGACAVE